MSTTLDDLDTDGMDTDDKAAQIAEAANMSTGELDSLIYEQIREGASETDGTFNPVEVRDTIVESIYDDVIRQISTSILTDGRATLTGSSSDEQSDMTSATAAVSKIVSGGSDDLDDYGSGHPHGDDYYATGETTGTATASATDTGDDDRDDYSTGVRGDGK